MIFKSNNFLVFSLIFLLFLSSCESAFEKQQRLELEEQHKIEIRELREKAVNEKAFKIELERSEREKEAEIERKGKAIYDKYINNSLSTGAKPYSYCFGRNNTCSSYSCSQIKVRTPSNSDVMVTIKKNNEVYRHAYINSGSQYTFEFPNGTYQAFFYYGKGWNPNKVMKETSCGTLKGGFITDEHFGKDSPQSLNNNILEYELILQQNGNFSTRPSNSEEAF
jgi:hypothetical protein